MRSDRGYNGGMTRLLEQAIEQVRRLPQDRQDGIARRLLDAVQEATNGSSCEHREDLMRRLRASKPILPPDYRFDRAELYRE